MRRGSTSNQLNCSGARAARLACPDFIGIGRHYPMKWRVGIGLLGFPALAILLTGQGVRAQHPDFPTPPGQLAGESPRQPVTLPASLQELFAEGVQAQKAGQLDAAEKALLRVLRKGGKVAPVYNNLGIIYQQRGDHLRALAQFREAIRLQPDYTAPRVLMGASLLALRKIPEATRELERAVALQPREPLARLELAKVYERAGNLPGVVDQFRALRDLSPQQGEYAYQSGNAYLKLAAWCYQQIVRLDPHSARAYQTLAENYRVQGRLEMAIRAFHHATQANPTLPGIHLALAQICLEQGNAADARKEVEQELAIVPESVTALALRRKLEAAEGQPQ